MTICPFCRENCGTDGARKFDRFAKNSPTLLRPPLLFRELHAAAEVSTAKTTPNFLGHLMKRPRRRWKHRSGP